MLIAPNKSILRVFWGLDWDGDTNDDAQRGFPVSSGLALVVVFLDRYLKLASYQER